MKHLWLLVVFLLIASLSLASEKVAVTNLSLITSMHPEMSLFDFEKLGFIKLPLGLTSDKWDKELLRIKQLSVVKRRQLTHAKKQFQTALVKVERARKIILNSGKALTTETYSELNKIVEESRKLNNKIKEIDYQIICPELTSLRDTRKRLDAIEREVIQTVKEVARKGRYTLVLNNSIPVPYGYPVRYEIGEMFGVGLPGIDRDLLYSFLANVEHDLPSDESPKSMKLTQWLEIIGYPNCQNLLPIRPYPLVLNGGVNIDSEVVKIIYTKYKIDSKSIVAACSVVEAINRHRADYQTKIPNFGNFK